MEEVVELIKKAAVTYAELLEEGARREIQAAEDKRMSDMLKAVAVDSSHIVTAPDVNTKQEMKTNDIDFRRLNEQIVRASDYLFSREYGVSASVQLDDRTRLGFGKVNGDWCLFAETRSTGRLDLTTAPLQVRLLAVDALKELEEALIDERKRVAEEVVDATAKYEQFADNTQGTD